MTDLDQPTMTDYSDSSATFGDRITAAREALGLSVAQLSRQLGVKPETINNWESDRSEPRANKLQMLAGVLNVSMAWLMTGEGEGIHLAGQPVEGVPEEVLSELRRIHAEQIRLADRLARVVRKISV